eukprot:2889104-Prymnesium_polylepis.1
MANSAICAGCSIRCSIQPSGNPMCTRERFQRGARGSETAESNWAQIGQGEGRAVSACWVRMKQSTDWAQIRLSWVEGGMSIGEVGVTQGRGRGAAREREE